MEGRGGEGNLHKLVNENLDSLKEKVKFILTSFASIFLFIVKSECFTTDL